MIKAKKGKLTIKGTASDILADFGTVCAGVFDTLPETDSFGADFKKEMMRNVFEFALLSEKEQQAELEKVAKNALSNLAEIMTAIVNDEPEEKAEEAAEEKEDAE